MQSVGMINNQLARHFKACECLMSSLTTETRQTGSVRNRHHSDRPRKTTRREDIDIVTLFRRYRFLSSARVPCLVRNATGTRICAKTVQTRLSCACLCWRRPYVGIPLTVLHKRVRLDCNTLHCRCRQDDIRMKLFSRKTSEITRHFSN